jgi:hypothetical protein
MATFLNFLRLTELATGEGSGTWGTTTNQSLELIGESLGYATQQAFSSDADATTTVADGVSDPARAMYFKVTSAGSLSATRTLTIAPNTISRVMFIENATSGSQSIAISQGSGANVTILTGKTAVVYLDGAGSGAAVVDAMLGVDPGVTDTLAEVLTAGNTTGGTDIVMSAGDNITNASGDLTLDIVGDIILDADGGDFKFRDGGAGFFTISNSSLDAVLKVEQSDEDFIIKGSDGGSEITALTLDMSAAGAAAFNAGITTGGNVVVGGTLSANSLTIDDITINSSTISDAGNLTIDSGGDIILDAAGTQVILKKAGTQFGEFLTSSTPDNLYIKSSIQDKDIIFGGNDGGSAITALTLDMSAAGAATFNGSVLVPNKIEHVGDADTYLQFSGADDWRVVTGNVERFSVNNGAVVVNEESADLDFRVESNDNSHMLFVEAGANRVGINNNDPSSVLHISGTYGDTGFIRMSGGAQEHYWYLEDALNSVFNIGTGSAAAAFDFRTNDVSKFKIGVSEATFSGTIAGTSATFTTADNLPQLQLISTDADDNIGPVLDLWRNSASPADGDDIGRIYFYGENDASQKIEYVMMRSSISDVTDATEDSQFQIYTYVAGSQADRLHINPVETIFNESSKDVDFRVESDIDGYAFFVNGADSNVGLSTTPSAWLNAYRAISIGYGSNFYGRTDDGEIGMVSNLYRDTGATWRHINADLGALYHNGSGEHTFYTSPTASAGATASFTKLLDMGPTGFVFNEGSADLDFRVESNGNANMLFVDANNNRVGIGTGAPSYEFVVSKDGSSGIEFGPEGINSTTSFIQFYNRSTAAYDTARLYMKSLDLYLEAAQVIALQISTTEAVINQSGTDLDFRVESDANANMLVVDASANVVSVGASTSSATLGVHSTANGSESAPHFLISAAASTYRLNMWLDATAAYIGQDSQYRALRLYSGGEAAGVALTNGATSFASFSDERLKENIEPVENALQSLSGLRTVKYHLKDVDGPEDKKKIGVIAQDLVGVLDEVIEPTFRPDDDTEYMGVRYTELVPVLIKAIQEQQDIIESLEARIAALES